MSTMKLIPADSKILREKTIPFDFDNPPMDPVVLFETLRDTMCEKNGVGLSANQIGLPYSVFVIGNPDDPSTVIPVFNPKIVDLSKKNVVLEEGCLSFPGLFGKVKRPEVIRVRYTNQHNNTDTIKFDGFTARVFLHEYDHLQGIVYTSKMSKFHLDHALRKKKQYDRAKKSD
jgi:peptide deformylase